MGVIRAPKSYLAVEPEPVRKRVEKPPVKHFKACFMCIPPEALEPDKPGKKAKKIEDVRNQPDMVCAICPRAFHEECLLAHGKFDGKRKARWTCSWHNCK